MTNATSSTQDAHDRTEIRSIIENWAVWRDSGDWERFRTLWHTSGSMRATWFDGPAAEFIRASEQAWNRGAHAAHFLGGTSIDVSGDRATAQTKMSLGVRTTVHSILVDVTCHGRFFDFFEKEKGEWRLFARRPIYERDRIDPVLPSAVLELDQDLLQQFPDGYRHLAYVQSLAGMAVIRDLPGLRGPSVEALYEEGARWLRQ